MISLRFILRKHFHQNLALKNAIDQVYSTFLPKANYPFVYMSVLLRPSNVDVNVHPTKHEVHFLHEDQIVDQIKQAFEQKLLGSNDTREFYTQQLLPGASDPNTSSSTQELGQSKEAKVYPKDMVRSDAKEQKLEKFFGQSFVVPSSQTSFCDEVPTTSSNANTSIKEPPPSPVVLKRPTSDGDRK